MHRPCVYFSFLLITLGTVLAAEIPLGSKISVAENNPWVSSREEFAIGFFTRSDQDNNLFSVGVHFNSIGIPLSQSSVVWVAGADIAVSNRSYFEFTENGELVLYDDCKGSIVWSSKTGHISVSSALLLDNGNLVLKNGSKGIVWQSFDTPSDTLLPGQSLSIHQMLRAASRNSVSSYYSLCFNLSGQLQLRWETGVIYWTTSRRSSSSDSLNLTLTSTGILELLDDRFRPIWSIYTEDHNDPVDYRFLRLDIDGNLRIYSWVAESSQWTPVWQAVQNQCDVFATCNVCGICIYNQSESPSCQCPFPQSSESNLKCLLPYHPKCESGSAMIPYKNTFLYGIYPPNDSIIQTDSRQCTNSCLLDPLCSAVTYTNDGSADCRIMKTQYVTGHSSARLRSISFVKTCLDPVAVFPNISAPLSRPTSKKSFWFCTHCQTEAALCIAFVFLLIQIAFVYWIWKRRRACEKEMRVRLAYAKSNSNSLVVFSYSEIREITTDFSQSLGPFTFKGVLSDNKEVVVKQLKVDTDERRFTSVVAKLGSIHHRNLLRLEGYCCEFDHRILVYEFAKNGSLHGYVKYPTHVKRLDWIKRIDICLSVARAISYLHSGCRELFNHGCFDCRTVLLDENLEAKVTKFGLGKIRGDDNYENSPSELDVADFGKMVITLISARFEEESVCQWAYDRWREGKGGEVVDERMEGDVDMEVLERTLRIAFWCLHGDGRLRPTMAEVVMVLEGSLSVDPPPPPFVFPKPLKDHDMEGM